MDVSLGLQIREVGFLLTLVQVQLLKPGERQLNAWDGLERKGASVGVDCGMWHSNQWNKVYSNRTYTNNIIHLCKHNRPALMKQWPL